MDSSPPIDSSAADIAVVEDVDSFQDLNFEDYLSSMTLIIFFIFAIAFFFEFVMRMLDRFLQRNAPQLFDIVQQLYKELMVCGFISIFIWISGTNNLISSITSEDLPDKLFDFLQMLIFVALLFYILFMFYLIFFSVVYMRKIMTIESKSSRTIEESYQHLNQQRKRSHIFCKCVHPLETWRFNDLQHQFHYHVIRSRFILQQGLTDRFNFGSYLRKCMRSVVAELIKIHWTIWLFALFIIGINGIRRTVGSSLSPESSVYNYAGLSFAVLVAELIIVRKCRVVTKALIKSDVLSASLSANGPRTTHPRDLRYGLNGSHPSSYDPDMDGDVFRISLLPSHLNDYDADAYVQVAPPLPGHDAANGVDDFPAPRRLSGDYEGSIFSGKLAANYGSASVVEYAPSPAPSPRLGPFRSSASTSNSAFGAGSTTGAGSGAGAGAGSRSPCASAFASLLSCFSLRLWAARARRFLVRCANAFSYPDEPAHAQLRLYWFRTPKVLMYTFRMCLFIQIGALGMYVLYFYAIIQDIDYPYVYHIAALMPHIITVSICIPEFLIMYSIISNVGFLTKRKILDLTIKQQQLEGTI